MVVAMDEAAKKLGLSYLLLLPAQLRAVDPCPWVRVGFAMKRVCTKPVDVQGLDTSATATSSLPKAALHDVIARVPFQEAPPHQAELVTDASLKMGNKSKV